MSSAVTRPVSLVVVGLGNIGSHLVPHLARLDGVGRVTLVDRDVYETSNLRSQDIGAGDVGRPKARVQAKRLRGINPALEIIAIADAVENIPVGLLRGAIVLGCLDSRAARRYLAAAAWHTGALAYIDAGVESTGLLARVEVHVGAAEAACFECAWDDRDYAAQEQQYPCNGSADAPAAPATDAPTSLGALAASLQAIECRKILAGWDRALVGRRVVLDVAWHKHYVTVLRRNRTCRFDHQIWSIEPMPAVDTIAAVLALGEGDAALQVPGQPFVRRLMCATCHGERAVLRLSGRISAAERACPGCRQPMLAVGFDMVDRLRRDDVPPTRRDRRLGTLGLVPGDVVAVRDSGGERYFQLAAPIGA